MTYSQAEDYLLGLELFGMRFGVDRMRKLMTALDTPQRRFESVHVVGSNGKTSTARMIAAILERHGVGTGTYTSPHLRGFNERIEVAGRPIGREDFAAAVARARTAAARVDRTAAGDDRVTQFEALTAAAYDELARRSVDVAVVEAGLGGRYDATNVIPSRLQVLTSIALEHTRWLGSTHAHIAEEKLAVVPEGGCLVTGPLHPEAEDVARRVVHERGARLVRAAPGGNEGARAPLKGAFQRRNFALARAAAAEFMGGIDDAAAGEAASSLHLAGRLEVVSEDPLVVYDGAHNPAGAEALAEALPEVVGGRPVTGVFAVLDDKDATAVLSRLLPLCQRAVYTRCANPRALPPAALESLAAKLGGPPGAIAADPHAAMARARAMAGRDGAVLATGSIYLLADLVRENESTRASSL